MGFIIFNAISFIFIEVNISYFWNVNKYRRKFLYMAIGNEPEASANKGKISIFTTIQTTWEMYD